MLLGPLVSKNWKEGYGVLILHLLGERKVNLGSDNDQCLTVNKISLVWNI